MLLVYFFAAVTAFPKDKKLKDFQALAGISNEEFDLLMEKQQYGWSNNLPMAKVGTDDLLPAGNPINFKSVIFNESMTYKNGVFLILDPGYYEVILNLLPLNDQTDLSVDIMVNNRKDSFGYAKATNGASLNMSSIVKLELYDTVHIRIRDGTAHRYYDANNFQIRKISEKFGFGEKSD